MFIHTALYAEAKPIIEFFDLKKVDDEYFKIYKNSNIILIISGIGKIEAAMALSHLFTKYYDFKKIVSIGIAAATKNLSIGELVNVNKIIDKEEDKVYHLKDIDFLKNLSVTTSSKPLTTAKTPLGDMESSALYRCAKVYKIEPTILKVVSDYFEPEKVKKDEISSLISININKISKVLSLY